MASGYIGKISAVVTANTADLSSKLRGSIQDWNKFGTSINSSLNKASADAVRSLDKIFTPIQKLERSLKAALSSPLNLRTEEQANQIRRLTSAAEQINKPLEDAVGSFNRLSTEVQANFAPALGQAQNQAQTLFRLIEAGRSPSEKAFAAVQSRVEQTTQAIQRLSQAQQLAARSLTGNELQFKNPALYQVLSESSQVTQRAAALPASQLSDGVISGRIKQLQQYQQAAVQAQARLEQLELTPNVDSSVIENQRKRVEQLAETTKRASQNVFTGLASSTDPLQRSVEERLKTQAAIQGQTKLDLEFQEAIQEALEQIKQDENDRLSVASQRLAVLKRESEILSNQGAASSRDPTGRSIENRLIDIDFQRQQREAQQLAAQRSAQSKALINATGGVGIASLNAAFDQNALRGYTAQLQTLQQTLGGVSKEARGPAIGAFNRLRAAIADAMNSGELETEQTRAKIKQLTAEAVTAAAKVSGVSQRALGTRLQRAGSIATGAFGNASLAIQQAAFAVDDFFSVTGGLDQRIRAAGNNLSQLGFIIGGTTGLIAGIAASIGSQLVVAFLKWINLIEDTGAAQKRLDAQLSSLNSSLDSQKNSVEALVEAYRDLSSTSSNALSDTLRASNANREQIERITRLQRERREADAENFDPTIIARRAEIDLVDRQLREESDIARRQDLLRQRANAEQSVAYRQSVIAGQASRLSRQLTPEQLAREVQQAANAANNARERVFRDTPQGAELRRTSIRAADERLAVARAAQSAEVDAISRSASAAFQQIRDTLSSVQQRASGVEGSAAISREIDNRATTAANLLDQAIGGDRGALRDLRDAAAGVDEFAKRASDALDRVEQAAKAEEDLKSSIERGRQLLLGESGRRAEQIAGNIGDIRNAGGDQRAVAAFLAEQARQIAPAVFALVDQSANSVLQGPSRARLNASDITTQAGTDELNRLIRGDDSARDQNLVELRRQTQAIEGLRQDWRNLGVAN